VKRSFFANHKQVIRLIGDRKRTKARNLKRLTTDRQVRAAVPAACREWRINTTWLDRAIVKRTMRRYEATQYRAGVSVYSQTNSRMCSPTRRSGECRHDGTAGERTREKTPTRNKTPSAILSLIGPKINLLKYAGGVLCRGGLTEMKWQAVHSKVLTMNIQEAVFSDVAMYTATTRNAHTRN